MRMCRKNLFRVHAEARLWHVAMSKNSGTMYRRLISMFLRLWCRLRVIFARHSLKVNRIKVAHFTRRVNFFLLNHELHFSFTTPNRASLKIPPLILLVPNTRFTNMIDTSFTLKPMQ